jgi:glucose-1-phosphate adenylyltransferase
VRICHGARLRRVIVDRHNIIEAGSVIGLDPETDRTRHDVTPGGVVVVPSKGKLDYFARESEGDSQRYED